MIYRDVAYTAINQVSSALVQIVTKGFLGLLLQDQRLGFGR